MSEENKVLTAETAEQVVEQKLKEATGMDVSFKEMDHLTETRLKLAFKGVSALIEEITCINEIKNREDRRNDQKVEDIIEGVKSLKVALMYAIAVGVDNVVTLPTFKTKEQATVAGMIAQLLDLRNLQLAANMRKEEFNNLNTGDTDANTNT